MAAKSGGERSGLAPVIPLFGSAAARPGDAEDEGKAVDGNSDTWARPFDERTGDVDHSPDQRDDRVERALLKKLRTRSLSVREARAAISRPDLAPAAVDEALAAFIRRGYLDDAALADQLVRAGTERKGQGRQVLAQSLAKRGIPRDIADAALAEMPDDDAERALAFARTRVHALRNVPPDAAQRRLVGQLSRRGYPASVALTAAREALREAAAER